MPPYAVPELPEDTPLGREARQTRALVDFFEQFSPADLARLDGVYAPEAAFKDPFNEVRGLTAVRAVYAHMFAQLHEPRFEVHDALLAPQACMLTWTFHYASKGAPGQARQIRGSCHLRLDDTGRILVHRDYWDTGEELYAQVPVLGAVIRWLRRRIAARV